MVQVLTKSTSLAFATTCLVAPHTEKDGKEPSSSQEVDSRISAFTSTLTQQLLWIGQDYYNPFHRTGLALDEPFKGVSEFA